MQIATNINTGSSDSFRHAFATKPINLYVEGVFDGASLALEAESPSGNFLPVFEAEITEEGLYLINSYEARYRLTVVGESASTSINAYVVGQVV